MSIQPFSSDSGFNSTGNITTTANIVGVTANNSGYLGWIGNSSGDNSNYTTLQLVPDDTLTGLDQYIVLDPTSPGHIHIRAGGQQDNSSADLFLGGENSHFKVLGGENPPVYVRANSNQWGFETNGVLTLPGEGILQSTDDTVTLKTFNTVSGNANSVYLGSSGGLGFNDQEIGGNWLEIFRNGAEPEIRVPVGRGNLNIQTAEGINAYNWTLDNTGNLTLPGNTFSVNYANGTQVSIGGGGSANTGNVTFNDQIVIGTGSTDGGSGLYLAPGPASIANSAVQYLRVRGGDFPTHIHLDTGNNSFYDQYFGADGRYVKLEANGNIVINADDYNGNSATWNYGIDGNLTLPGNTFAVKYANGTPVSIGGGGVTSIVAGTGITIDPAGGTGAVTVNYAGATYTNNDVQAFLNGTAPSGIFEGPLIVAGTTPIVAGGAIGSPVTIANYAELVADIGDSTGTLAIEPAEGTIQRYTLTGNITINGFATAVAGTNVTLVLTQDATGGRTLTSTMKFLGGVNTLSTAPGAIDVLSVFYDGVNYLATLGKGYA